MNLKEINAFALPGGPMFVNRGMFDAAAAEGEVVGVMAHELSHVLLRHGTANATKAQNPWLQLGQIAGVVGGAVVGGAAGSAIAQGSQFGLGTLLLRYSRDFEKQADLLGAQIMARAGYDPRALARMFETIEKRVERRRRRPAVDEQPPESRQPDAVHHQGSRAADRSRAPADTSGFAGDQGRVRVAAAGRSRWPIWRSGEGERRAARRARSVGTPGQPVPRAVDAVPQHQRRQVFQARVPATGRACRRSSAIKVVPQNGYGQLNGQTVFTHGVEFGVAKAGVARPAGSDERVAEGGRAGQSRAAARRGSSRPMRISQRSAIATPLVNPSPLGGQERIGRLHDVPRGRQPVLLPDARAGERRRGIPGSVPARRRVNPAD